MKPSSPGPHSNSYFLIYKILACAHVKPNDAFEDTIFLRGALLLASTRIYTQTIKQLLRHFNLHAIIYIIGGGLIENIPRVLPYSVKAILKYPQLGLASNFSVVAKK